MGLSGLVTNFGLIKVKCDSRVMIPDPLDRLSQVTLLRLGEIYSKITQNFRCFDTDVLRDYCNFPY